MTIYIVALSVLVVVYSGLLLAPYFVGGFSFKKLLLKPDNE